MRIFNTVLIFLGIAVFVSSSDAATTNRMYGFKSAIYEMKTTGTLNSGNVEGYIDDYGTREAQWKAATMDASGNVESGMKLDYREGSTVYQIDLTKNSGTKKDLREASEAMDGMSGPGDLSHFNQEVLEKFGADKMRTEKILGKVCEVYFFEAFDMTAWLYKWFPMKTEVNFMGLTMLSEVVRFEENVKIPPEKLRLPEGVQITEGDLISESLEIAAAGRQSEDYQVDESRLETMIKTPEYREAMQNAKNLLETPQYDKYLDDAKKQK